MAVEIQQPDLSSGANPLVQLLHGAAPSRTTGSQAEWPFIHAGGDRAYFEARAAYDDGALVGWGSALRGEVSSPSIAMLSVTVTRVDTERRGSRQRALPRAARGVAARGGRDDRARRSTTTPSPSRSPSPRAHGFEVTQHGIESELALDRSARSRQPGPGSDARGRLVSSSSPTKTRSRRCCDDSQTNPEAAEGFVSTLDQLRGIAAKVEQGRVAALARVDGAPAALIVGEVPDLGVLGIAYTGVGRALPGAEPGVHAQAVRPPPRRRRRRDPPLPTP